MSSSSKNNKQRRKLKRQNRTNPALVWTWSVFDSRKHLMKVLEGRSQSNQINENI